MGDKKQLSHNEAEVAILGGVIIENGLMADLDGNLEPVDFYFEKHRVIYATMQELKAQGLGIDAVTIGSLLEQRGKLNDIGGYQYLTWLPAQVPSTVNIVSYAMVIRDAALRRHALELARELETRATGTGDIGDLLSFAESGVVHLNNRQITTGGLVPVRETIEHTIAFVEHLMIRQNAITGIPTGLRDLDAMLAGLQKADLIIIAARPSMGKTAFACDLIKNAAITYGIPGAFFSVEMPNRKENPQITLRLLCAIADVDSHLVRTGTIHPDGFQKLIQAAETLYDAPIYIDDQPGPLSSVRAKIRKAVREKGIQFAVIDYLQLMDSEGSEANREQEIAKRTRALKMLAKELNIPIVVLSQLNRSLEARGDKRPIMSDIRESGSVEQDADVIMFLYRDEVYNKEIEEGRRGQAEVIVAKQRNGPTGTVFLRFLRHCSSFTDWGDPPAYS